MLQRLYKSGILIGLLASHLTIYAETRIEVLTLRNRSAETLIPLLQPLMDVGEILSGTSNQLIIKATPETIQALKKALLKLDKNQALLRISIRQEIGSSGNGDPHSLKSSDNTTRTYPDGEDGYSGSGRTDKTEYRTLSTHNQTHDSTLQFVQTLENQPAFIETGSLAPAAIAGFFVNRQRGFNYGVVEQNPIRSGFYVIPHLNGNQVSLQIAPKFSRLELMNQGTMDNHQLQTTVTGRLGQWITLGGHVDDYNDDKNIKYYRNTRRDSSRISIWVKVELVR